ncbi:hypothetical protein HN415_01920, partial [Candidatus Woesearchaeota archaeon]|nr:hypothetical protein [Candidatus Woesearchaeota archaeon]
MKHNNIIWIATEGNRFFKSNDGYGRLKIYDELPFEFLNFKTAIASATSTLMSTSSFFTGMFSHDLYYDHSALKDFETH